jgi:hypothetical protein
VLKAACAAALLVLAFGCERPIGNAAVEGGKEGAPAPLPTTAPDPAPSAIAADTTSASPPMMPPSQDLVVNAHMQEATIKRGGNPSIVFELQNRTQAPLVVPHPTVATAAVTLRVTLPSGDVRVIYSAPRLPGVPPHPGNVQLVPGRVDRFATYLGSSLTFEQPGPYTVGLEYPWRTGQVWTSTLHFVVQ